MRFIKTAAVVLIILVVTIAVIGLFLPARYSVERSVEINASPGEIHEYVGDLKKWDDWSPWKEEDPSIVVTLGEKTSGVGASQSWVGESGTGALTITESSPDKGIEYDLLFDGGTYECVGSMKYDRLPDGDTKVTWVMSGDMGKSLASGYFALLMDTMVGGMFEKGLSNLKKAVEKGG
ncbi:MAG: SRPBCC family protein [Thermodesulfobacteriota bacterium]